LTLLATSLNTKCLLEVLKFREKGSAIDLKVILQSELLKERSPRGIIEAFKNRGIIPPIMRARAHVEIAGDAFEAVSV